MIHNVVIMTGSGLVIFEKIWVESDTKQTEKGGLFGSLLTAMQEMARQSTGLVVSYLEFSQVAISIVDDSKTKLLCILFHDIEDGADFGKTLANQILGSFLDSFSDHTFSGTNTMNIAVFSSFSTKLIDAIQNCVQAVVLQLQYVRGITHAMVLFEEGTPVMPSTFSDHSSYAQSETSASDQLGIVANLQPLITVSNDLMLSRRERPKLITMEMGGNKVVYLHRISDAFLVCVCKKNVKSPSYEPAINHAVLMLSKVFAVSRSLSFKSGKF